jgi:predicted acyltransferase
MLAAGFLLRPLHGFSKDHSTESWGLATAGISCLLFLAFYYVLDVRRSAWRLGLLRPAGQNPLLAYILPDALGSLTALVGVDLMPWYGRGAWSGCANAALYTLVVLALTGFLTRRNIILKL